MNSLAYFNPPLFHILTPKMTATITPTLGITASRAIVPAVLKFVLSELREECAASVDVDEGEGVEAGLVA